MRAASGRKPAPAARAGRGTRRRRPGRGAALRAARGAAQEPFFDAEPRDLGRARPAPWARAGRRRLRARVRPATAYPANGSRSCGTARVPHTSGRGARSETALFGRH